MPENQNIEWKAKWKDDYLEWICGFANAQGGKIYIGCDDDGKVIGLPNIRKLLEDVPISWSVTGKNIWKSLFHHIPLP